MYALYVCQIMHQNNARDKRKFQFDNPMRLKILFTQKTKQSNICQAVLKKLYKAYILGFGQVRKGS